MIKLGNLFRSILSDDSEPNRLNPLLFLLCLLSLLYSGIIWLRNRMYDLGLFKTKRLGCKVISVGNITVGGTGKTPLVIMLANFLRERGYRPAVLSRGYGGENRNHINLVSDGSYLLAGHGESGDEPVLIAKSARQVPVITGPKRYLTGKYAMDHLGADTLIMDDAFQHRSLFRDIDIVLLDGKRPFGNGFLLPGGHLRESRKALKRADAVVLTETEQKEGIKPADIKYLPGKRLPAVPIFRGYHRPKDLVKGGSDEIYPLEYLKGKKVCAFAGIARPESFKKTIKSLGGEVVAFITFPDHHRYTTGELREIEKTSLNCQSEVTITTEKDGIKLIGFPDFFHNIFLLGIEMEIINNQREFEDVILSKLSE